MTSMTLKSDLSLRTAHAVRDELSKALEAGDQIAIDGSSVAQTDVTGVQLLISALVTARRTGRVMTISAMSETLEKALSRSGLTLSDCGQRFVTAGDA